MSLGVQNQSLNLGVSVLCFAYDIIDEKPNFCSVADAWGTPSTDLVIACANAGGILVCRCC